MKRHKPVKIALTQGKFALVDKRDVKRVGKHKWNANKASSGDNVYAIRTQCFKGGKRKNISMHRVIMDAKDGQIVDHIDGNTLNNTRRNLRFVTKSQNRLNMHARNSNTGLMGVSKIPASNKKCYQAKLVHNDKQVLHKVFDNKYEAAAMYDHVKRGIAGEYGSYNYDGLLSVIQMRNRIYKSKGIFSVVFRKRSDDSIRLMTARVGVTKDLKGGQLRFDAHKKRLITVYDMGKRKYRLIPIDGLIAIKINGKFYGRRPNADS